MGKWRSKNLDQLAKKERMTKSSKKKSDLKTLEEEFEISEKSVAEKLSSNKTLFVARVVEVHKRYAFVSPEPSERDIQTRDVWMATVARKHFQTARNERNVFSVGDKVLCAPGHGEVGNVSVDLPQCTVEYRQSRSSKISRLDPMTPEREHILAANMDQLVVVASFWAPKVKWGLIDRYIVIAEEQLLPITIIINKEDLLQSEASESFRQNCFDQISIYKKLGYKVILTSAAHIEKNSPEWVQLSEVFADKVSLISGHSGVGKSSLANLLDPEIEQDVESEDILTKGRHTTTYASFIKLGAGGYIIDTPGIRSFIIQERTSVQLSWAFKEIRPFLNQCKYRECQHYKEPECVVKEAVEQGKISKQRYNSYLGILTGATGREGRVRELED